VLHLNPMARIDGVTATPKRSAIYQRMSEGRFPKARSLGVRCTVWIESEIDNWMREQVADGVAPDRY